MGFGKRTDMGIGKMGEEKAHLLPVAEQGATVKSRAVLTPTVSPNSSRRLDPFSLLATAFTHSTLKLGSEATRPGQPATCVCPAMLRLSPLAGLGCRVAPLLAVTASVIDQTRMYDGRSPLGRR